MCSCVAKEAESLFFCLSLGLSESSAPIREFLWNFGGGATVRSSFATLALSESFS
jgi:hypothetical protein